MAILVTGAAGFIGYHVCQKLLSVSEQVIGLDNLNDYYDPALKNTRLAELRKNVNFTFYPFDITKQQDLQRISSNHPDITRIIHLAAQAGVRYSIKNPHAYVQSNIVGHVNLLEFAVQHPRIDHLVYASSSSVYGNNAAIPFSVKHAVQKPVSVYAATKIADEALSYSYSHMYDIPITGLRFFTVYGPYGRPDMATYLFTQAIINEQPINLYNNGEMKRDFTYIDDIVEGIISALHHPPTIQTDDCVSHQLYNLGNHRPERLSHFVATLEKIIGKKAIINPMPMQDGDMEETYADIESATRDLDFLPSTPIEVGLRHFVDWYKSYH